jgi:fumarate reductase subunit C
VGAPVSGTGAPTPFHPRWHRTRTSTYWWLERRSYLVFILREVSSLFVAWFVAFLVLLLRALGTGPEAYAAFVDWSRQPTLVALNTVTLAFVLLHAITWFNLAPKAMVVSLGGRPIPGALVAGANYLAWLLVSAGLAWVLVRP